MALMLLRFHAGDSNCHGLRGYWCDGAGEYIAYRSDQKCEPTGLYHKPTRLSVNELRNPVDNHGHHRENKQRRLIEKLNDASPLSKQHSWHNSIYFPVFQCQLQSVYHTT